MAELTLATTSPDSIFPVAFGHEHETGHQIGMGVQPMQESSVLAANIYPNIPSGLRAADHRSDVNFLLNGFKIYRGGNCTVEVVTPECDSPMQVVQYRRAAERLTEDVVLNFAKRKSSFKPETAVRVRLQNRVVDSQGSRKASHMNAGLADTDISPIDQGTMVNFFSSRSFVTGAGYVGYTGTYYSQKLGGLEHIEGYGYFGSMYRMVHEDDTRRFEDRSGDINISDWAVWQHAGSLALALAVARTPLAKQLPELPLSDDPLLRAKSLNVLRLNEDGSLRHGPNSYAAVDYQQTLAELVMDKMIFYVDELPDSFYQVARSLYKYCQDYRQVLNGEADISLLADRSDWALKMSIILKRLDRDRDHGLKRSLTDYESRAGDMRYDQRSYVLHDGEVVSSIRGAGFKMRDRGTLSNMVTVNAAEQAYRHAPTTTRAHLRTDLQRRYLIKDLDWHWVSLADRETDQNVIIRLDDVRATSFSKEALEAKANIKEK